MTETKLVPVEPTEAMATALLENLTFPNGKGIRGMYGLQGALVSAFKAAVAAAPPEPDASARGECERLREENARLDEALREDHSKWSFDLMEFVARRLIAEAYQETVFPNDNGNPDRDSGPVIVSAVRELLDLRRAAAHLSGPDTGPARLDVCVCGHRSSDHGAKGTGCCVGQCECKDFILRRPDTGDEARRFKDDAARLQSDLVVDVRLVEAERERAEATALLLEVKPLLAQVALQALVGSEMYRAAKHSVNRIDSHLALNAATASAPTGARAVVEALRPFAKMAQIEKEIGE